MHIDNKTYVISEDNRYKTEIAKSQIIIGTSLRKDSNHIIRLQHKEYGKTKQWNTYTISRAGTIYEHYDPKYHTDFLDIKEVDKKSISIILENMGCLFETPTKEYVNWLNEVCSAESVAEKPWFGYHFWEKIPDNQIESMILLCRKLCEDFNITKNFVAFHHYHKDIVKFRGIVFRSNYIEDTSDINPFLEMDKFNEMLHNEFI